METFSIIVNGVVWNSGLTGDEADELAAEYRMEEYKNVVVLPD